MSGGKDEEEEELEKERLKEEMTLGLRVASEMHFQNSDGFVIYLLLV